MKARKTDENPNAFKHLLGKEAVTQIATSLKTAWPPFNTKSFLSSIARELDGLELKARVTLIAKTLRSHLPDDYQQALSLLLKSTRIGNQNVSTTDKPFTGFKLWPYTEFIQVYGLNHLAPSLEALKEITILFTGEFAVRPFIKKYPQKTLAFLKACAKSDNAHVRRWASEGSRPRLPWGERLDLVIQNPTLTLEILELLKHDPELYVRKSVANHLNDISKDNPKVAIETLKRWSKASRGQDQNIAWITRHALRTLIKKGDPAALALIGIKRDIKISVKKLKTDRASYRIGDKLEFSFEIVSTHTKPQDLVIDYIVHYVKSNGATSPKVFKFKTLTLKPDERVALRKVHHLKQVTTRRHYSGKHTIEIQINGLSQGKTHWPLKAD